MKLYTYCDWTTPATADITLTMTRYIQTITKDNEKSHDERIAFCVGQEVRTDDPDFIKHAHRVIFIGCNIRVVKMHDFQVIIKPLATINCRFIIEAFLGFLKVQYMSELCFCLPTHRFVNYNGIKYSLANLKHLERAKKLKTKKLKQISFETTNKVFSESTVVCGMELEIPMISAGLKLDKRSWFKHTDNSQIKGNLEAVSVPLSLHSMLNVERRVSLLYKKVGAPKDISLYGLSELAEASGIHVHFSWSNTAISSGDLQETLYDLCDKRGGKAYLLRKGGKSLEAFNCYSKYQRKNEDKYNAFHQYDKHRLEMRWLNNHPDPRIVASRVRCAVLFFVEAFMMAEIKCFANSLDKTLKLGYNKKSTTNKNLL